MRNQETIEMNSFERIDSAVSRNDYAALIELLKTADVDSRDGDGRTPLMYAILAEHADPKMIEFLVEHGADVNVVENTEQWTPLHFAARDRKAEIVNILLQHGAIVDCVDSIGNTPLANYTTSAHPRDLGVVDLLLANGADPSRTNNSDGSPVDIAQSIGDVELIERLERPRLGR